MTCNSFLDPKHVPIDLEQIMAPLELVTYGLEVGMPRCEFGPASNILDFIDELLKLVEELFKILEGLDLGDEDGEVIKELIQALEKLRQLIDELQKDLFRQKIRQDLEKSLSVKTENGVPRTRKKIRKVRWRRLFNSNKEILNGISSERNPKHWLLIKINEYSFLVTIEELGPNLPDSNWD